MSKLVVAFLGALAVAFAPAALSQDKSKSQGKAKIAGQDMKFMREMAQVNLAEVQAGKLAMQKASSDEVKKFGQHMIDDHGKALSEARTMAKSKGAQLPSQPRKKDQEAMKKLQQAKGESFDKEFMQHMVKGHEEALKLHQQAAKSAKDPQLKAQAEKSVPVIEQHLEQAKSIAASLK